MAAKAVACAGFLAVVAMTGPALSAELRYDCSGGTRLTAAFSAPGATPRNVVLTIAGERGKLTLPQVVSADGGRYASGAVEFWIKGNDATLARAGKSQSETCRGK
ncbi:hypothetical protein DWF00_05865 [Bosea caraganae]|uniref:C-type lysozyme inhibitor domain-containing protein n=1 Tax=Bosea caraganae TaxID=2763117 RepID=A0A370L3N0_9HYPH|nr:MliC family protein [Bosea caraganae]RDJ22889.1 hypothetical protein DWE98_17110 [Bosea caraganae]RDJ28669.1 hypothetical protein DWF00_05865 [Bosea caraganae]